MNFTMQRLAFSTVLFFAVGVGLAEAQSAATPQLGNGSRNGWVDQNSIVIWTRTTQNAEMVAGPEFLDIDKRIESEIRKSGQADRYVDEQLPDQYSLNEMLGACPGVPGEVGLSYHPVDQLADSIQTPWITTKTENDCTAQWKLNDLRPGTRYVTRIEARPIGGRSTTASRTGSFKTAPAAVESADVRFCVTTCHDFLRRDDGEKGHKIYPSMTAFDPDFVVHAGDIEYYDKPQPWAWTKELMRFKWSRIFSMPRNRAFYETHSSYFIKDDHDTLKDDSSPGQVYGNVTFDEGIQLFNEEQFPSRNKRYHTIRWGRDVQIWLLEGRDYRSPNTIADGPDKTILGTEQKSWLKQTLTESTAAFKLVFSPTPIVGPDRTNKKDNHANVVFAHEGQELRNFFSMIDGIVLFCGDRHWQYASVDVETGLWEFGCGPGSEKHQLGWEKGDVREAHQFLRVAGGFLSGEVTRTEDGPHLTLRHHAVDGTHKSKFKFPRD
jgi:alkaline phosphatase D